MAALARATALAPVVAHQGVARRSYGARVPAMASRVPSANLAAPLRSVGGKQVRIARPDRRAGCRQNLTLANPQRRCAFPAVRCARGWSGPTRDSDGPIDPWTTRATPIEHLHSIARAGSPPIAPSNRSLARAPRPRPLPLGKASHVMCHHRSAAATSRLRHVHRARASPFTRSSLTVNHTPTPPPTGPHALLHGPQEVRGAAQVSAPPARTPRMHSSRLYSQ